MNQSQYYNEVEHYISILAGQTATLSTAENKMDDVLNVLESATRDLRGLIMDSDKAYFIAVNNIDLEYDYIRRYTLLSYITEDQAARAVKKLSDPMSDGRGDVYRKVSEEEYNKFDTLRKLSCFSILLQQAIEFSHDSQFYLKVSSPYVTKDINRLRRELGLTAPWDVIAEDVYHPTNND